MRSITRFMTGFILGGVIGAAVAVLLAPYSGQDLRGQIQGETNRIQLEVKNAAAQRRADLEKQLATLRTPGRPS